MGQKPSTPAVQVLGNIRDPAAHCKALQAFSNLLRDKPALAEIARVEDWTVHSVIAALMCDLVYHSGKESWNRELNNLQTNNPWMGWRQQPLLSHVKAPVVFCVAVLETGIYVAIRGTDGYDDWRTNVNLQGAKFLEVEDAVHKGFHERANMVPMAMMRNAFSTLFPELPMVNVGHSQGGAVAVLATSKEQMSERGAEHILCITFGQPSVFYTVPGRASDGLGRALRFVRCNDPVPTMQHYLSHMESPECLVEITHEGDLNCVPSLTRPGPEGNLDAHRMSNYTRFLTDLVPLVGPARPIANAALDFNMHITGDITWKFWLTPRDRKLLMEVTVLGRNVQIVNAGLLDGRQVVAASVSSCEYRPAWPLDGEGEEDLEETCIVTLDITRASINGEEWTLWITNGFDMTEHRVRTPRPQVVVVGPAGHGKSHLVRALDAHHRGLPYPEEREVRGHAAPRSENELCDCDTFSVCEQVGFCDNDDMGEQLGELAAAKANIVTLTWKYGIKFSDARGQPQNLRKLCTRALRRPIPVLFVLTNCTNLGRDGWREKYDTFANDVLEAMQCPRDQVSVILVNSIAPVHGISELHQKLRELSVRPEARIDYLDLEVQHGVLGGALLLVGTACVVAEAPILATVSGGAGAILLGYHVVRRRRA